MRYTITAVFGLFLLAGVAVPVHAAELSLSPASGSAKIGDTFSVNLLLDTEGEAVDGVDINALHYNPDKLSVVDADTDTPGVQITAGSAFKTTMENVVDTKDGAIVFSQVTSGGERYVSDGAAILATITFRVREAGTARLTFDFDENRTDDSNVAAAGSDVLTGAADGMYILIKENKAGLWARFFSWIQSWF